MRLSATTKWCLSLAGAILLFYWKLFLPNEYTFLTGSEDVNQAFSWFNFWARSLGHGTLPLWDPFTYAGHSFAGEMQTAAFYPLYLVLLVLRRNHEGLLTAREYNLIYVAAHLLAALFMFALIRELRLSRFAAFLSGFCFSTGGFVGRVNWPHLLQSALWGPLVFLFLLRALRQSGLRRAILNSILTGCFLGLSLLAGGLHIAMAEGIAALSAIVYFCFASSGENRERSGQVTSRRALAVAGIVVASAICASAVQLAPSHLYAEHSLRWGIGFSYPSNEKPPYIYQIEDAVWPSGLLMFLFPAFDNMGQGEVWPPYIGVLPFALAIFAVWRCWPNVWVRFWTCLGAAAFLYALAGISIFHGVLVALTPWLWLARESTRFLYLTQFALAILAAFGADFLAARMTGDEANRLKPVLNVLIILSMAILCIPVFVPKQPGFWQCFSTLLILLSCALLRFSAGNERFRRSGGFRVLIILLVCFDLNGFNWSVVSRIELDNAGKDELLTLASIEPAVEFLRAQPQLYRVSLPENPKLNIGDAYGIQSVTGAGVTLDKNFYRVMGNLDLLNAGFIIRRASQPQPGAVYQDDSWKIYKNEQAFPRSWLVHQSKYEADPELVFAELDNHAVNLRLTAILSEPLRQGLSEPPANAGEHVSVDSYSASRIRLSVHAAAPGLLMLSEMYDPEWTAQVNGKSVAIIRADGALRSVPVPAGDSLVEFAYRPWSVYIGALISALAFAAAGWAALMLYSSASHSIERRAIDKRAYEN